MFEMIQCRFSVVAIIMITLVFNRTHSHVTNIHKRGNVDVFNLLLSLYKLNPLKASKVYKTFSDRVLSHGDKIITTLNFDSNETNDFVYKEKPTLKQLNELEKLIHTNYKRPPHNSLERPEFDIEDVGTEKFNVDIVVNENLANKYTKNEKYTHRNELENFSGLISHLGNDLNDNDELPSTKLVSVNNIAITKAMASTKLHPRENSRGKNIDEIFGGAIDSTVEQIDNNIQNTPVLNDNIVEANVVVL